MRVVDDFSFMSIVEAEIIKKASGKPFDKQCTRASTLDQVVKTPEQQLVNRVRDDSAQPALQRD